MPTNIVRITGQRVAFSAIGGPFGIVYNFIPKVQPPINRQAFERRLDAALVKFASVKIECGIIDSLSPGDRAAIFELVKAADLLHDVFWMQTSPDSLGLRYSLKESDDLPDRKLLQFLELHCGSYDRIGNLTSIIDGKERPLGAGFYPEDINKKEFEAHAEVDKSIKADNTVVKRTESGALVAIPYTEKYKYLISKAADRVLAASEIAETLQFRELLQQCEQALRTGNYREKDMFWVTYDGKIDFIVGPIETYEDKLIGLKAAFQAAVLIKDMELSKKLEEVKKHLPDLQNNLPVGNEFKKKEVRFAPIGAYDLIYASGLSVAGPKSAATNLPNDEVVKKEKGARQLMFKNVMDAKFKEIVTRIAENSIVSDQLKFIDSEAFFIFIVMHEISHSLGLDYVIGHEGEEDYTIRKKLDEKYSAIEEAKADIVGLYNAFYLIDGKILSEDLEKKLCVTYIANLFRSARFGTAVAHGVAAMMQLNYLQSKKALYYDEGRVRVNFDKMREAIKMCARDLLVIEGKGNKDDARKFIEWFGYISEPAQKIIDSLGEIPVDIDYEFEIKTR